MVATTSCPGCGLELPPEGGPTHAYLGSSAACWAAFGRVLALEYEDRDRWPTHTLSVDAYALQHPGVEEPRTTRSACIHLISLQLRLELGMPDESARPAMVNASDRVSLRWLEPPPQRGETTVLDVLAADDAAGHRAAVTAWARSVWDAWSAHHEQARRWAEQLRGPDD